jgi:hypothetical protein
MSREIQWRRVLVEAIVIVASILLAFGIEAWWAVQGERRLEREELGRVRTELMVERERIAGHQRQQEERASASLDFVGLVEALGTGGGTIAVPDSLLALLAGSPTYEAQTPTLDGLLRSGGFAVVRHAEVRSAIARLEERLASALRQQQDTAERMTTQLIPALIERGDMSHVLLNSRGAARLQFGGSVTQLRADPQIKGMVSYRYIQASSSGARLAEVGEAMDRLLAAIIEAVEGEEIG